MKKKYIASVLSAGLLISSTSIFAEEVIIAANNSNTEVQSKEIQTAQEVIADIENSANTVLNEIKDVSNETTVPEKKDKLIRLQTKANSDKFGLSTIGEVFWKGSVDGKKIFMVVGMKKGLKVSEEIMKHSVTQDNLKWIKNGIKTDSKRVADDFYNKSCTEDGNGNKVCSHDGDFKDHLDAGIDLQDKSIEFLSNAPGETLKQLPESYKLTLQAGKEAQARSKNTLSGAAKYGAYAVWANIKGAYYLVIELPTEVVVGTAGVIGSVPASLALNTAEIGVEAAYGVSDAAVRTTLVATKGALYTLGAAVTTSYAVLTSTVATAGTVLISGAVLTYKGVKYLTYDLPRNLSNAEIVSDYTTVSMDSMLDYAQMSSELLEQNILTKLADTTLSSTVGKLKSQIVIKDSKKEELVLVTLTAKKSSIFVEVVARKNLVEKLKKDESLSKSEAKKKAKQIARDLLKDLLEL